MRSITESIDYLQRNAAGLIAAPPETPLTGAAPQQRRLWQVRGIGRYVKYAAPSESRTDGNQREPLLLLPPTRDLLTGLFGFGVACAYVVSGTAQSVSIQLGVWTRRADTPPDLLDRRSELLASLLRGLYPEVDVARAVDTQLSIAPLGGLALGVPTAKPPETGDVAVPWDRLIRSLRGTNWTVLVLALPVGERAIAEMRDGLLNEIRMVRAEAASEQAPTPLVDYYVELLNAGLAASNAAAGVGAWRTAVYLLGDAEGYPRLASAWRSVFSGPASLPEPVRVFDWPDAARLAANWAMSELPGTAGPAGYRRPVEYQTILTSAQLAAYVHLPELETPGFAVDLAPRFDSVPVARPAGVSLGPVLVGSRVTVTPYRVPLTSLTRHAFVAGLTGSGKTNTIVALLGEADAAGVPFLVVEPVKTEYRALLAHPSIGPRLRIFTAGNEAVSPLRLNPFEVPPGVRVSEHLDLLRAAFGAAFGLWSPLPQVLERCLHEVYVDRGWDLRANANPRLDGTSSPSAFPTISDLIAKVGDVVSELGYEPKIAGDIRAALQTRLESLRTGGKGAMLDVARSVPMAELVGSPTVLELEAMGDDSDKAFLMGLLLIRLAEHRRTVGQQNALTHLLVIEEAHRLLSNVPPQLSAESANPRGQAVETFSNLLSEIRVYGQGVIMADQVPVRLVPDVVKNSNLKIAHRIVSADDRDVLAAAMAMDESQARGLAVLPAGRAAVFSEGDDAPILVQVPLVKDALAEVRPDDEAVAARATDWQASMGDVYQASPLCAESCVSVEVCAAARRLAGDETVQSAVARMVQSALENPDALDRMWPDVVAVVRPRRAAHLAERDVLAAVAGHTAQWFVDRRGARLGWRFADSDELARLLCRALLDRVAGAPTDTSWQAVRDKALILYARDYDPYPHCGQICPDKLCLYRPTVADLVASDRFQPTWRDADAADAAAGDRSRTWSVCQDAAYELIEFPEQGWPDDQRQRVAGPARRAALCFEQQMLADDARKVPRTARVVAEQVLRQAGV